MKNLLITGGAGYIGSVLSEQLVASNFKVTCVDKLDFGSESIDYLKKNDNFELYKVDINNFDEFEKVLKNKKYYAVIHLASIVGDPACSLNPELAEKTNWLASKWLIDKCIDLNIERFIFASTCSNYGKMQDSNFFVNEESSLSPVSLYAELKVKVERYILENISGSINFCPTILRFSTVYGISKRMRFDLTVNEFVKELYTKKKLLIFGEQFWRPYCHVNDFAQAYISVLNASKKLVSFNVYNVGDTSENYTKQMIVDKIKKKIDGCSINYVKKEEDPRDYRVNSDKIKNELGFTISMTLESGIDEIINELKKNSFGETNNQKYYNIPFNNQ